MTWWLLASAASRRADLGGGPAAHPGVDLVEDQRRHRVGIGQHHLQSEHHPGQLTAGGALADRQLRRARVRDQHDVHLVDAIGTGAAPASVDLYGIGVAR